MSALLQVWLSTGQLFKEQVQGNDLWEASEEVPSVQEEYSKSICSFMKQKKVTRALFILENKTEDKACGSQRTKNNKTVWSYCLLWPTSAEWVLAFVWIIDLKPLNISSSHDFLPVSNGDTFLSS